MKRLLKKLSFAIRTNSRARTSAFVSVFVVGLLIGFFIEWKISLYQEAGAMFNFKKVHPLNNHSEFTNPLIGFDTSEKTHSEYTQLKNKIQALINDPEASGQADNLSIYFRNLETGEWVGINQNEDFNPASLFKVPVMMFYFKLAESDPDILLRTYAYSANDIRLLKSAQGSDLSTRLIQDKRYTVNELLYEMIVRSDNVAKYLLILNSAGSELDNMYGDLGIQIHKQEGNRYTISPRTYSLFFRTLYNVTFLNGEMSERALEMLNETDFKDGLVAGVPSDVKVAHKFGQYTNINNGAAASVEAHDCGIIYYPRSPYLLCVMTRGKDTKQLEAIISQISRITYDFVHSAH